MKKILTFGGSGLVGSKFIEQASGAFEIESPSVEDVDILDKDQVAKIVEEFNPDTVLNFAAFTQVEEAEKQKEDKSGICYLLNAVGAKNISEACKSSNKKLVHISTDYVFDGKKEKSPYTEEDRPNPVNWYGQTKFFGEQFILESGCDFIIIRISMPFRAFYELKKDIARFFLEQLKRGEEIRVITDQKVTPTLVDDIAAAIQILIDKEAGGIYNVCSKSSATPFEFASIIAQVFNLDKSLIKPIFLDEYNREKQAKILKNSWLDSSKFEKNFGEGILHTVEEGIRILKRQLT